MIKELFLKKKKIFSVHSPSKEWTKIYEEYRERDTMCDLCKHKCKEDCHLVEITTMGDTRKHFINDISFVCPLKKIVLYIVGNSINRKEKCDGRIVHATKIKTLLYCW